MTDMTPPYETFFIPKKVVPKPWVGLTDEELEAIVMKLEGYECVLPKHYKFYRAISAKLKEKNT